MMMVMMMLEQGHLVRILNGDGDDGDGDGDDGNDIA